MFIYSCMLCLYVYISINYLNIVYFHITLCHLVNNANLKGFPTLFTNSHVCINISVRLNCLRSKNHRIRFIIIWRSHPSVFARRTSTTKAEILKLLVLLRMLNGTKKLCEIIFFILNIWSCGVGGTYCLCIVLSVLTHTACRDP